MAASADANPVSRSLRYRFSFLPSFATARLERLAVSRYHRPASASVVLGFRRVFFGRVCHLFLPPVVGPSFGSRRPETRAGFLLRRNGPFPRYQLLAGLDRLVATSCVFYRVSSAGRGSSPPFTGSRQPVSVRVVVVVVVVVVVGVGVRLELDFHYQCRHFPVRHAGIVVFFLSKMAPDHLSQQRRWHDLTSPFIEWRTKSV